MISSCKYVSNLLGRFSLSLLMVNLATVERGRKTAQVHDGPWPAATQAAHDVTRLLSGDPSQDPLTGSPSQCPTNPGSHSVPSFLTKRTILIKPTLNKHLHLTGFCLIIKLIHVYYKQFGNMRLKENFLLITCPSNPIP